VAKNNKGDPFLSRLVLPQFLLCPSCKGVPITISFCLACDLRDRQFQSSTIACDNGRQPVVRWKVLSRHPAQIIAVPTTPGRLVSLTADKEGDSVTGPAGKDGVDGKSAKISIGSVSVGGTASVSLREEGGVQILDFVLPRGEWSGAFRTK
jgi:hypothetical protein